MPVTRSKQQVNCDILEDRCLTNEPAHLVHSVYNIKISTVKIVHSLVKAIIIFCLIANVFSGLGQDVGVLRHTAPDELCQQVY